MKYPEYTPWLHRLQQAFVILLLLVSTSGYTHNSHPLGKEVLDWQPAPSIARALSLNFNAHAGHFIVAWRPPGGVQSIDGRSCLHGPYFLFDVEDSLAFDTDATVTLEFLVDRETTRGMYVSYDQVIKPLAMRIDFDQASEGRWYRSSVTLDRARFANRLYEGTDLSIAALEATHPHSADDDATITICDLNVKIESEQKIPQHQGRLKLHVVNELGQADSARLGLYDAEGRAPLADDSALSVYRYVEKVKQLSLLDSNSFWPGSGRYVSYVDGQYELSLSPGDYDIVLSKGPEYRIIRQKVHIEAHQLTELTLELERWIDMPAKGWYSGDDHIHIGRPGAAENEMILGFSRAEDIHVANLLQMANVATWHFPQYAFGQAGQFRIKNHALVPGQETPRTAHLGHTIGLNGKAFHWPRDAYYIYQRTAERIHADGGLFGYAHVALADVFNLDRGLALDVPLGNVDFLEVLQRGMLNTGHLYNFLNLGYKLLPSAGSDYPYIHLAGTERTYVKVAGKFSPAAWFEAWKRGRSFVSNGPVLTFAVNGDTENREISLARGETLEINALARVNPDLDRLRKLELVLHGEVIATASPAESSEIILKHVLQPETSAWLALRTEGENGALAHTAPVFVTVNDDKRFWKRDAVEEISLGYIKALETLRGSRPELHEDFELFNTENSILPKWEAAKPELDRQVSRAINLYRDLIEKAAR